MNDPKQPTWVLTDDPDDIHDLVKASSVEKGVVSVLARPASRRVTPLLVDLASELGVDVDATPNRKDNDGLTKTIMARMTHFGVRHWLLLAADHLVPEALTEAISIAERTGVTLWLVVETPSTAIDRLGRRYPFPIRQRDALFDVVPQAARDAGTPEGRAPDTGLPRLPSDHFLFCRAMVHRQFAPHHVEEFDRVYVGAYDAAKRELAVHGGPAGRSESRKRNSMVTTEMGEAIEAFLRAAWAATEDPEAAVASTLATQAACLTLGLNLHINTEAVRLMLTTGEHRRLTSSELSSLLKVRDTRVAFAIVLVDAGLTWEQVCDLTLDEVSSSGFESALPLPLKEEARTIVRLALLEAAKDGAPGTAALVDIGHRFVQANAKSAASSLGIASSIFADRAGGRRGALRLSTTRFLDKEAQ